MINPRQQVRYNIRSAIDYTIANNPDSVHNLIVKYGMPAPQTEAELLEAARVAVDMHGSSFAHDMAMLHPDLKYLLGEAGHYGKCCSGRKSNLAPDNVTYNLDALKEELARLEHELETVHYTNEDDREKVVDRIEWLKQQIARQTGSAPAEPDKGKTDYMPFLALGLFALAIVAVARK